MHLYEEQFSERNDLPRVESPSKVLIIASTGRCGSHMLGHALYRTNRFGFPLEYAHPKNIAEWKRRLKLDDFRDLIQEIQKRRTSSNGVFGIKIHYPHINQFGGFQQLIECFPDAYYILLSRKDVLKQAVSLSMARQTGVWISGQQPKNDDPKYNFNDIDNCLRETILNTASWKYKLSAGGCNYIEIDFDNLRQNLTDSISKIANFVGVKIEKHEIPTQQVTKKQSNTLNDQWETRFLSEFKKSSELIKKSKLSFLDSAADKLQRLMVKS